MSDFSIRVEGLSKRYRIGLKEEMYDTLAGTIASWIKSPLSNLKHLRKLSTFADKDNEDDVIWAVKDISFETKPGEVVGIIGRNGAGKSTLLKIISKITEPTSGNVVFNGRVSSLLEVGTGFHPELTGRENVYLNGAVLGMTKKEIDLKFDEIVAFSEVEKFLDTPVKRYSSGMKVRLAFAVAAHLEPEILLIDEVLAVGDVAFQKKCLGKMKEVGEEDRTVILVSHNMTSIMRLCNRAILLEDGEVRCDGPVNDVVKSYMVSDIGLTSFRKWGIETAPGNDVVRLISVKACTDGGEIKEAFDIRKPVLIEFEYFVSKDDSCLSPAFWLMDEMDTIVFISGGTNDPEWIDRPRSAGLYKSRCLIPGNFLAEGTFTIHAVINTIRKELSPVVHIMERDTIVFQVYDRLEGGSVRGDYRGAYFGVVRPMLEWETSYDGTLLNN